MIGTNTPTYAEIAEKKDPVEQVAPHIVENLCFIDMHNAKSSPIANAYYEVKNGLTKDITDEQVEALKTKMTEAIDQQVAIIRKMVAVGYSFTW